MFNQSLSDPHQRYEDALAHLPRVSPEAASAAFDLRQAGDILQDAQDRLDALIGTFTPDEIGEAVGEVQEIKDRLRARADRVEDDSKENG